MECLVSYTPVFNQDIQIKHYSFLQKVTKILFIILIGLQQ